MEPRRRVQALAIPAQQAGDRERMAQIMEPRRCDSLGDSEPEPRDEMVERLAGGTRMHAATPIEGEERGVGRKCRVGGSAPLELLPQERAHARPVGDEPALAELAAADDEEVALDLDVADAEPAPVSYTHLTLPTIY